MKNCDFKQVMKVFIVCFVLLKFGSVETAAIVDCPPQQVLHFNPETSKGICCIPVPLPKGFGFKSCTRNGTHDTIEVCPTKLYQWDNTTTATETTCMAEMHCLDVENLMIEKCDDHGRNCRNECVCNFPGGFCGTEYFNCNPFPVGCLRNNVQEDCSCRSPGLEPDEKIGKSDPDLPNPITPIASVSRLPSSPASGKSDKKIEGVPTADVGNMNETDNNNNDTKSQTKPEESFSIGFIIWPTFAVIAVIGGLIFVYILWKDRCKRLWGKCKRENQNKVTVPDEPAELEIMTQPFLSEAFRQYSCEDQNEAALSLQRPALPEEVNGAQSNLLEDPHFPTLGSSLFDSCSTNSTADQQEVSYGSGRDQTHVKEIITSENRIEEEGHDSGALENSRLCHVASERDGEEEEQLL